MEYAGLVCIMALDFEKCKVMHIGNTPHSDYYVTVSGNSTSLSDVTFEKDLGVWTTDKLESGLHSQKAVVRANRILGMIRRAFYSMSGDLFMFLYKTYVRPHLEYCIQLWCPYLGKDIDILEKVKVRATKFV